MTARFRHGLVVGKFYPPHAGHHFLIDTAAAACGRVSVVVAGAMVESIPQADRAAWLAATHAHQPGVTILAAADDHPVDYDAPAVWDAHVAVFEAAVARGVVLAGLPAEAAVVDAVFSSEPYGAELARRLGALDVRVDQARVRRPCSGAAVRADVVGRWSDLAPATRAGLALRVVFVGAESTGTTTASVDVAAGLRARGGVWAETAWVGEYGRAFTLDRLAAAAAQATAAGRPPPGMEDLTWTPEDFVAIAERQLALEDEAAAGSPVVVCDTDAFATGIWHERYLGARHAGVEAVGDARNHHLYLLTDHHGVAFDQDGIRDGEHLRPWMTRRFAEALTATGRPWRWLTGPPGERAATALAAIDALCAGAWRFADPLAATVDARDAAAETNLQPPVAGQVDAS
jgi:NadR type nicotinamide-nucleotide adenylyltransferase